MSNRRRLVSVGLITLGALLAVNRAVFMNLVKSTPTFGVSLLSAMAERLRNTAAALN